nr:MAG TPA: hypothetical protein [Caudoviricetes sp.]
MGFVIRAYTSFHLLYRSTRVDLKNYTRCIDW